MVSEQSFKGVSHKHSLQEAINDAIQNAATVLSEGGSDIQIKWRLESIEGTEGGFTGLQDLTVNISAHRP